MADKLLFKKGTQAAFDALTSWEAGAFYLTTDTHRLYNSIDGNKAVPVNQGVITVAKVADLPTTGDNGQFYYATLENVLCIYSGNQWVQINPDTHLTSTNANITVSSKSNKKITISDSVKDSKNNVSSGSFQLVEGDGITLAASGNEVTITANIQTQDAFSLGVDTNGATEPHRIVFKKNGEVQDHIAFKELTDDTYIGLEVVNAGSGSNFIVVKDSNLVGKIDGIEDDIEQIEADLALKANAGDVYTKDEVYTKEETDEEIADAIKGLDAMKFKGIVDLSGDNDLPDIGGGTVQVGDTYKVAQKGTYASISCQVGDLLIAKGTEDESGYIVSGTWEHVPVGSSSSQVIAAGISGADAYIRDTAAGKDLLKINTGLGLTYDNNGSNTVYTIKHAATSATTQTGSAADVAQQAKGNAEFTAITKVGLDAAGHVTALEKHKVSVVDTHNTISSLAVNAGTGTDNGKITFKVTNADGDNASGNLLFKSNTMECTTSNGWVNYDILWDTFGN